MNKTFLSGGYNVEGSPSPPAVPSTMSIDRLLPALLECFGIILCGYIAGRTNIITTTQAKGLGNFVSKFALPALLFKNMVLLDFGNVIWPFLWGILIAKVAVFCIVCFLTLIVSSPDSRYSKAGIFSIFATQSNDFALGYPIVEALYQSTYPEYLQYIYLVAPVSLMLLNPVGFALCEIQKWKNQGNHQQRKLLIVGHVVLQVLKNPIVFMVIVGIIAHFALHQRIPAFMAEFIDGLGNSFGGAALFYLGLTMVGQLRKLTRSTVVTLILLITAKLLVLPLLCKDMVDVLDNSSNTTNHSSLSDYAFLYGVFPTAPSVAIYAVYYNAELEVVTAGMVISTFLSAPIMYVSAWLLTIHLMDPQCLMNSLESVSFNISIVSLVALLFSCIGMILWNFVVKEDNFVAQVLIFTLLSTSLYSSFMWPGLIALSIVLMKKYEDLRGAPGALVIAGWGIPSLVTSILLIFGEKRSDAIDSLFFYGKLQIICTTVVVSFSILLGGGSLLTATHSILHKYFKLTKAPLQMFQTRINFLSFLAFCFEDCKATFGPSVLSLMSRFFIFCALLPSTVHCENGCESTDCLLAQMDEHQQVKDRQVVRHVLLCLLLTVFLLANLSSGLWLLYNHLHGRLYLELQFFCAIANYGQGFISFALFGLDKHIILLPLKRLYSRCFGKKKKEEPDLDLPDDIRMTCLQFTKYHKQQCCHDIVKKRRCGVRTMLDCFRGCELVDWLQQVGLAQDRGEAVLYGTRLQQGGVLQHIKQEYSFEDSHGVSSLRDHLDQNWGRTSPSTHVRFSQTQMV
uniref:G protein-coupled receptor 155a n=1 Tax=Xiphophorus couchianus TaxID=32473 RepID=A0A3B5MWB6_9TELE